MKQITILGRTPSKKNSKKIFVVRGRLIISPSTLYEKWHKDALLQLRGQKPIMAQELTIKVFAADRRASDLTNRAESVMDTLVDAGLLVDDNWFIISRLTLEFGGVDKANPRAEIFYE